MAETSSSLSDKLSRREGESCERIIAKLDGIPWAQPSRRHQPGGIRTSFKMQRSCIRLSGGLQS